MERRACATCDAGGLGSGMDARSCYSRRVVSEQIRFAENLAEVARRGGRIGPDSRLLVVRCTACHHQSLYDETHDTLFLDASDLHRVCDAEGDADVAPCPGCGDPAWEFEDVVLGENDDAGPWAFCFWQPPDPKVRGRASRVAVVVAVGALAALGAAAVAMNPDPLGAPGKARPDLHDRN